MTAEELTRRRVAKVKSERNRVHFLRRKMEAANTIQRWWYVDALREWEGEGEGARERVREGEGAKENEEFLGRVYWIAFLTFRIVLICIRHLYTCLLSFPWHRRQ